MERQFPDFPIYIIPLGITAETRRRDWFYENHADVYKACQVTRRSRPKTVEKKKKKKEKKKKKGYQQMMQCTS